MRLTKVQDALQKKKIKYEYTEVDNCGSLDFLFRGLKFHVWEYEDKVWGAETNVFEAGRSQDIFILRFKNASAFLLRGARHAIA